MLIGIFIIGYYAVWTQDINDDIYPDIWYRLPLLYKKAKQIDLFSYKRYLIWTILGIFISVFLDFYINLSIGSIDSIVSLKGYPMGYEQIYLTKSISLIIITMTVVIMDFKSFTFFTIFIAIGIFSFGLIAVVYVI